MKCAGFCLACCYNCHEGHNLVELYTKRNFRCDCGNSKFANFECKLENNKGETNPSNLYNHNFWGLYCVCKRPYPDEEDTINDVMIQCVMCEDWYHSRHLGVEVDPQANFSEMICEGCVKNHDFLLHYDSLSCNSKGVENLEDSIVDIVSEEPPTKEANLLPSDASEEAKSQLEALTNCKMPKTKSDKPTTKFFADITWRQKLCTCVKCMKIYEDQKVLYLIDPQDPVQVYESKSLEKAKEKKQKQEEQFLKSVDRVPLMEMLAGYQELKDKLGEFLSEFKNNKRVVREQDIKEFFEEMNAKKKQRTGIQHYCR